MIKIEEEKLKNSNEINVKMTLRLQASVCICVGVTSFSCLVQHHDISDDTASLTQFVFVFFDGLNAILLCAATNTKTNCDSRKFAFLVMKNKT